ncbi:MAG: hypothetical protein LBC12_04115, partial [Nitrososphaerota archaeon]|nr:hypothetical protein [Nitrososphaerota archaeon]
PIKADLAASLNNNEMIDNKVLFFQILYFTTSLQYEPTQNSFVPMPMLGHCLILFSSFNLFIPQA